MSDAGGDYLARDTLEPEPREVRFGRRGQQVDGRYTALRCEVEQRRDQLASSSRAAARSHHGNRPQQGAIIEQLECRGSDDAVVLGGDERRGEAVTHAVGWQCVI